MDAADGLRRWHVKPDSGLVHEVRPKASWQKTGLRMRELLGMARYLFLPMIDHNVMYVEDRIN